MLKDATELIQLMKQAGDQLLAEDERLQEYLQWLKAKADSLEGEYTTQDIEEITRKFSYLAHIKSDKPKIFNLYLYLDLSRYLDLNLDLNLNFYLYLYIDIDLNLDLYLDLYLNFYLNFSLDLNLDLNLDFYRLYLYQKFADLFNKLPQLLLKKELQTLFKELQTLFAERPDSQNEEQFEEWYKENNKTWMEKLRQIMITYRNIGHDWQFNEQQKDLLNEYRNANILLMKCLGREAVIDRGVRAEIENTLFLPVSN
jgi:hypothetical protein